MGIEPAVYAGIMAFLAIMGIGWKALSFVKDRVKEEVKPVQAKLDETTARISAHEAQLKFTETQFTEFRLEVARIYTTKEDVANAIRPVLDSVERLTNSVDNMNTRIDRVIEQSNAAKTTTRRAAAK